MFIELEQQLIKKSYKDFKNINNLWSYCKKTNPMNQINHNIRKTLSKLSLHELTI